MSKEKLKTILKLLKFLLTIEDKEILHSTIEAIIEMIEEDINN